MVGAACLSATESRAQTPAAASASSAVTMPTITGKTTEGKPFALSSLKGKGVLVL